MHKFFAVVLAIIVFVVSLIIEMLIVEALLSATGAHRVRGAFLAIPFGLASLAYYYYPEIAIRIIKIVDPLINSSKNMISNMKNKVTATEKETKNNLVSDIKELKELLDSGVITEEEFQSAKSKLIKS